MPSSRRVYTTNKLFLDSCPRICIFPPFAGKSLEYCGGLRAARPTSFRQIDAYRRYLLYPFFGKRDRTPADLADKTAAFAEMEHIVIPGTLLANTSGSITLSIEEAAT